MSHRSAVYTVHVHRKGDPSDQRLLGDIDDAGTSLISTLGRCAVDLESRSSDGEKIVRTLSADIDGDELHVIVEHGESGVAADIVDPVGTLRLRQRPEDTQRVRCGCLVRLPPTQTIGFMAVHVNNNRGVKGLLSTELTRRFRYEFDDLILVFTPYVLGAALTEAVDQGRIEKVKLIRLERPTDRASEATNKWVRGEQIGRLELDITATGRAQRLIPDRLRRYLHGDAEVFGEIVEFHGLQFEQAKVEVVLGDGTRRTFDISAPESGHPFTEELSDLAFERDGTVESTSLFNALARSLDSVRI